MKIFKKQKQNKLAQIKSFSVRAVCLLALFLMPNAVNALTDQERLDQINREIQNLYGKVRDIQGQRNSLEGQLAISNAQINQIQLQINATQLQISITNSRIAQTEAAINKAELDLKKAREQLSDIIRTSYEESQQSHLEVLVKSNSFSEFVNRAEYLESIQLKIKEVADKVVYLRNQLENDKAQLSLKKAELQTIITEQQVARGALQGRRYEQQVILNAIKGDQAQYNTTIKNKEREAAELKRAIDNATRDGGSGSYGGVPQYFQTSYSGYINGSTSSIYYYGCGVASIAMVLSHYGYQQNPSTVASNTLFFPYYGSDLIAWQYIPRATNYRFKIEGNPYSVDWAKANHWSSIGKPFIVWVEGAFGGSLNHFVVIVGKNSSGGWIMNDPVRGGGLNYNAYYSGKRVLQMEFISPS